MVGISLSPYGSSVFSFPLKLIVLVAVILALGAFAQTPPKSAHVLFTGDILLSRRVVSELQSRNVLPWAGFADLFHNAQWISGNLEGAFGQPSACVKPAQLCFAIPASAVQLLRRGGFTGLTLENNHAADLGSTGRERTRILLESASLAGVDFEHSPRIVRIGDTEMALLSLSLVPAADNRVQHLPSPEVAEKLQVAREQANLVVVSIHWGEEYQRLVDAVQRTQARWLVQQGADVIIGHHPHVVQPPECVGGRPVFFSLGNHLFDQTYPPTKDGLIADCRISGRHFVCQGIRTRTENWTTIPTPLGVDHAIRDALAPCAFEFSKDLKANPQRRGRVPPDTNTDRASLPPISPVEP